MELTFVEKTKDCSMINPSFVILIEKSSGKSFKWKSVVSVTSAIILSATVGFVLYLNKPQNEYDNDSLLPRKRQFRESRNLFPYNSESINEMHLDPTPLMKLISLQHFSFNSSTVFESNKVNDKIPVKGSKLISQDKQHIVSLQAVNTRSNCPNSKSPETDSFLLLLGGKNQDTKLEKSIEILGSPGCSSIPR